jgi:hypothetical protein
VRDHVQLFASEDDVIASEKEFGVTTDRGLTFTETEGAGQLLFEGAGGVAPVQFPLQSIEPVAVAVWPQTLADEVSVQAVPYVAGLAGGDALQTPLTMIPEFD